MGTIDRLLVSETGYVSHDYIQLLLLLLPIIQSGITDAVTTGRHRG